MRPLPILLVLLAACATSPPEDPVAADLADYAALQRRLDASREEFLGEAAGDTIASGNRLFWLDRTELAPVLHGYDERTGIETTYAVSIGQGEETSYVVSPTAIATVRRTGDVVRYSVHDAAAPARLLGTVDFPAPTGGVRWWAYALDGDELYVVTTGGETTLHRVPPGGAAVPVTTLESAGCEVGELWDFTVAGSRMIVIESGRIWSIDLPSNTATWLGNQTEATAGIADPDGVVFATAEGPFFYRYQDGELVDLRAAIATNAYALNDTFRSAHLYAADLARFREWFVYIGASGVFAYDLKRDRIAPLLLSPHGEPVRIDYRYPTPTVAGSLYVTGLTSTTGAVGADGPIYRLDLSAALAAP